MKVYKSSDLTHKRAEVLKEAKVNGVVIQERNTNGDVRCEFVLQLKVDSGSVFADTVNNCYNVQVRG